MMYEDVKSLCIIPEVNPLYISYISIKNKHIKETFT